MKRNKMILLTLLLLGIFITGCGAKSSAPESAPNVGNSMNEDMKNEEAFDMDGDWAEEEAFDMDEDAGDIGFDESAPRKNKAQKLIYRATRRVEVRQKIDPLVLRVQNFVESHDGYIESMEQYRNGYDPVTQEQLDGIIMVIRIPHEHYNKALTTIDELGAVIHKSSSVEDVTLQYSDLESTLKMYKVEQERLLEMMENETADVTDIIEIEKRLSEVRIEIERYASAKRALESLINYDTIELEIDQVRTVSNINETTSFGQRIRVTFMESIDNAIIFMQELVIGITYMFIPLLILAIMVGIGYLIISTIIKVSKNKKDKKSKEKSPKLKDQDDQKE
ncbi:MAG TPA: DUF4349 domain-containing protein [Epulopiscium sp.]|nr:DUF4349 domain-containing protein [Candidatus Epulonipiscium sp.]